jgi:uncharacterized membrane protein
MRGSLCNPSTGNVCRQEAKYNWERLCTSFDAASVMPTRPMPSDADLVETPDERRQTNDAEESLCTTHHDAVVAEHSVSSSMASRIAYRRRLRRRSQKLKCYSPAEDGETDTESVSSSTTNTSEEEMHVAHSVWVSLHGISADIACCDTGIIGVGEHSQSHWVGLPLSRSATARSLMLWNCDPEQAQADLNGVNGEEADVDQSPLVGWRCRWL